MFDLTLFGPSVAMESSPFEVPVPLNPPLPDANNVQSDASLSPPFAFTTCLTSVYSLATSSVFMIVQVADSPSDSSMVLSPGVPPTHDHALAEYP